MTNKIFIVGIHILTNAHQFFTKTTSKFGNYRPSRFDFENSFKIFGLRSVQFALAGHV